MFRVHGRIAVAASVALLTLTGGKAGHEPNAETDDRPPTRRTGFADHAHVPVAQHRSRPGRPVDRRERREGPAEGGVLRRGRRRPLEDDGRRQQLGAGHRRPDRVARSARWPCPNRIPTSSTSARARRASAATSCRATASTSPPTPARPGRTSASATRRASRRSASTRPTPTSSSSPRSASYGAPSEERGVFKSTDGGKTWRKVLFRDDKTGAIDISIDRTQSERDVRGAVGGVPQRVPDVERRPGQRPVQVAPTAARPGPRSRATRACPPASSAASASRCPAPTPNRVYALVENENGGLFSSDDAGATWTLVNEQPQHPPARVLLHARHRRPEEHGRRLRAEHVAVPSTDGGKTLTSVGGGTHGDHHDLWIDPDDPQHLVLGNDGGGAVIDDAGGQRWTDAGLLRPRSSTTSSRRATCRITSAARSRTTARCACRATPAFGGGRRRRRRAAGGLRLRVVPGRRRRARLHRARSEGPRRLLRRHATTARSSTRFNRRTGELARGEPVPAHLLGRAVERRQGALAVDVPDHLLAGRSERALHLLAARLEDDQRRPDAGTRSAATSRATIRRRMGHPAGRSRTT